MDPWSDCCNEVGRQREEQRDEELISAISKIRADQDNDIASHAIAKTLDSV